MEKYKQFILNFFNPVFWVSFICLTLTLLAFKVFNLPINSINEISGIILFIYIILGFSLIKLTLILFTRFKEDIKILEIFKEALIATKDFIIQIIPFFIFLYIYDSIHDITRFFNSNNYDEVLISIDRALLFGNDIAVLFEKLITPGLTSWFAFAYTLYFVFYFVNPIIYSIFKSKRVFETLLLTVIITNFLGLAGYVLVPCDGPLLAQKEVLTTELITLNGEPYYTPNTMVMEYLIENRALHCFPSLHFGVTFIWLYFAWKYLRKNKYLKYLYYLHIPLVTSVWLSTLYLRWHYLIDLLAGLLVAFIAIYLAPKIMSKWLKFRDKI
ncbi:phosphatase PAP2 family protein [bacterium]|jgi:membrane-associated phospholipid phosphatase|nr:phosphatase PAP2 family protein [bacterium]MBT4763639.1 phosphatase PAP2 family protein [bacterium]MBT5401011.1 phosphatase PAP2 family protein [bacterium]MBT6067702.1 phosphatase PAP2 family protein [bacterium]